MDAVLQFLSGIDGSVGILAALGAAFLIARGARIRADGRTAERERKLQDIMPAKRGR